MRTTIVTSIVFLFLSITQGCGRLISEGVGTVTGAKGTYLVLQPIGEGPRTAPLASYTEFELLPLEADPGVRVPLMFTQNLPEKFQQCLIKEKFADGTRGKTLVIRGRIMHYESAGLAGEVFGPFEEVVARTELVDKQTGKVLGVANCIGRSEETVNEGPEDKAAGLAKAIVNWIKANRNPPKEK